MTKAELKILVEARLLLLAEGYTARAKYYILDLDRYQCYNKVLNMVKYISNSSIDILQVDLEMLVALTYQYSDLKKALIKKF